MTQRTRRRSRVLNDVDDEDHEDDDVTMSMVLWAGSVEQRQLDVTATATCREWLNEGGCIRTHVFAGSFPTKGWFFLANRTTAKNREPIRWSSRKLNANSDLKMSFRRSTWNLGGEIPSGWRGRQVDMDMNRRETWTGMDVNKHERTL